ncbi:MAG: hypothetical protein ACE5GW_13420, partial [Planctomycetota bacterium]
PTKDAINTGLEEAVELSLDGEIALRHGAERLDGPLRLTLVLGPSSDPDGLAAEAAIHLSPAVSREPASASGAAGSEDGQAATAASPLSLEGCRLTAQLQGDPIRREDLAGITPERLLSILQGSLRAEAGALSSGDALLEGLQLEGELGEGQARVALAAPARLKGGNIDGNASYRGGRWELALSARDVITSRQLVRLLARISPVFALAQRAPEAVDCRFGGEVIAGGCTGSQKEMIDCLAGTGSLTVSAGSFAAPAELAPLLELLPAADRKRLTFEAFAQPFELSSGRVLNRGFQLAANDAALLIEGHTTLAGELHHNVRLDQVVGRALGRKGRKGREWQIARGILEQNPIVIEGSVDRPRLRLPSPLGGKNPLKGALDTGLDLLRKEAEERASSPEGVEGLIKEGLDLFKKKKKKKP